MKNFKKLLLTGCFSLTLWQAQLGGQSIEETFTNIYDNCHWGKNTENKGTSGPGSSLKATTSYRVFLQQFLKAFHINNVVDFGCGDWEFSQHIDWNGITYTGYDVVKHVVETNQQKYAKQNVRFIHENGLMTELPSADLLICKDVLQHLSLKNIKRFLKQTSKFKYCLITNDVHPHTLTSDNPDIPNGSYRHLDLTAPPFNVNGLKVLNYEAGCNTKQVLLITNN